MHKKKQWFLTARFLLVTALYVFGLYVFGPDAFGHITGAKLQNFQYNAELVPVAPIVDGYLDDPVWEDASTGKLTQEVMTGDPWPESDDFTGTFAAVWRSGFLYIAIEILDDSLETHEAKLLREDHLVLYLDPHHSGYKDELYRYEIPIGRETNALKSPLTRVAWGNDGKTCELSFRLDALAEKGNVLGFGIAYNDVDSGRLQNRIAWGPEGYTTDNAMLPDLVFTAEIKPNTQQKLIQWGRIKSLY